MLLLLLLMPFLLLCLSLLQLLLALQLLLLLELLLPLLLLLLPLLFSLALLPLGLCFSLLLLLLLLTSTLSLSSLLSLPEIIVHTSDGDSIFVLVFVLLEQYDNMAAAPTAVCKVMIACYSPATSCSACSLLTNGCV